MFLRYIYFYCDFYGMIHLQFIEHWEEFSMEPVFSFEELPSVFASGIADLFSFASCSNGGKGSQWKTANGGPGISASAPTKAGPNSQLEIWF